MHYCMRCGKPCDCWAFDQSRGDYCDGCTDCGLPLGPEDFGGEDYPSEDTGRYEGGYRTYRDGTTREDFGSDR